MPIRVLILAFCVLTSLPALASEVHLSVATSLTDAVRDILALYGERHDDVVLRPNFASSGALARQIDQGAPAHVYASANAAWMQYLVGEGRVVKGSVHTLARNRLVFVGAPGSGTTTMADLAASGSIALGSPRSVPAGTYARQALEAMGLYEELRPRMVLTRDVRQALLYADRGETDGAFVYRTDARLARNAVVLFEVPTDLHEPIVCPVGLTPEGSENPAAVSFFAFLVSAEARAILEEYGFDVGVDGS
ncbi:MAG TPA: molybdate ABC transporter substrate-binding protein [Candidatus Krumholzibacteria bacterium]|nr:molybdate ABC transporter substrate-binding protein [Candidatus Krumholzibacteria bacterium]